MNKEVWTKEDILKDYDDLGSSGRSKQDYLEIIFDKANKYDEVISQINNDAFSLLHKNYRCVIGRMPRREWDLMRLNECLKSEKNTLIIQRNGNKIIINEKEYLELKHKANKYDELNKDK